MDLSIIIPLCNEAPVIARTLDRLQALVMPEFVRNTEIIVVDDSSSDGSATIVERLPEGKFRVILIRININLGKGGAVAEGVRAASGDIILVQDADLELDPDDIPALLKKMNTEDLDLVSGTRFRGKTHYPLYARPAVVANRLFSLMASLLTYRKITDFTCGYKIFRKSLFDSLDLKESRFGFETELMLKSFRNKNLRYGECDVSYAPRRRAEGKKIRVSDGLSIAGKMLKYSSAGKNILSAAIITVIITIMLWNMLNVKHWRDEQRVIEWDAISYYAYLPAAFIYHDLSLGFIDGYDGGHKLIFWPERSPTGKYVIKTTMGLSLLWLPFFLAGHVSALLTGADAGGYSEPYKLFLLLSALTSLLTGLIYLRKILLAHFSDLAAALTLAAFAFATNLYWYTLFQGTMSHVYSFALITAFIWYSMKWHDKRRVQSEEQEAGGRWTVFFMREISHPEPGGVPSAGGRAGGGLPGTQSTGYRLWPAIRLGLLLGLISLIRPTNIIIILFLVLYGLTSVRYIKARLEALVADYRYILLMMVMVVVVWVPQMIYWREMTGQWLYFSYGSDERFFFGHPAIIKGLFSFRKGLFIYTPLLIFAFAGLIILLKKQSPFALTVTVFLPVNIYIIFSWWCWWYGGGFGQRAFIDSYALMAVSAAALLQYAISASRKWLSGSIMAAWLLLFLLGIFNNIQYYYGAIHWDSMTGKAYLDSFGRVRPSVHFYDLLQAPDYDNARKGADR